VKYYSKKSKGPTDKIIKKVVKNLKDKQNEKTIMNYYFFF